MSTRRDWLKGVLKMTLGLGAWGIFHPLIRSALAKAEKIILPGGTPVNSLIRRNPANLDTRNLLLTPLEDFGTMGLSNHRNRLRDWRLRVDGHVESTLWVTYRQILELPAVEREVLLICPGFFANHGRWRGVSIASVLEIAGMRPGATHVSIGGPRGIYEKVKRFPIEEILHKRVFLAYQVNGEWLPVRHGYPLRLVAEDHYGYDWIKYADRITVYRID